jgi:hypothetical protein
MIDLKVSAHLRLNLDKVPISLLYEVVVLLGFINIYNKFTLKF